MGSKSNRSRRYSEEFKRDAVALVLSSSRTVTEVARELGVSTEGLRNWVRQDRLDRGQGTPVPRGLRVRPLPHAVSDARPSQLHVETRQCHRPGATTRPAGLRCLAVDVGSNFHPTSTVRFRHGT
ncbi:transposase [Streptomyces mangrovi]|uniref:transposase n=1 Tax=Streptomyces mangrovi TaxID=1206892 RepID=UPI00399D237C